MGSRFAEPFPLVVLLLLPRQELDNEFQNVLNPWGIHLSQQKHQIDVTSIPPSAWSDPTGSMDPPAQQRRCNRGNGLVDEMGQYLESHSPLGLGLENRKKKQLGLSSFFKMLFDFSSYRMLALHGMTLYLKC